jgi:hypothetical protein
VVYPRSTFTTLKTHRIKSNPKFAIRNLSGKP